MKDERVLEVITKVALVAMTLTLIGVIHSSIELLSGEGVERIGVSLHLENGSAEAYIGIVFIQLIELLFLTWFLGILEGYKTLPRSLLSFRMTKPDRNRSAPTPAIPEKENVTLTWSRSYNIRTIPTIRSINPTANQNQLGSSMKVNMEDRKNIFSREVVG